MAALEFRSPKPDELHAFWNPVLSSYGMDHTDDDHRYEELVHEEGRSYGALDDGEWVGGSGAFSFRLTVPGGAHLGASGITMVGVAATHRRRGILTEMMRWLHDDAASRGESLAILTASEARIYRRFGYGVATEMARVSVPSDAIAFDPPLPVTGRFRRVRPSVDTALLAEVYEKVRVTRVGWFDRHAGWWDRLQIDNPEGRGGASKLFAVVHEDAGGALDGYATWRIKGHSDDDRVADDTVVIQELVGTTPDVEAALWQFLANIDLANTLVWNGAPVDSALRWRLVDARRYHQRGRSDWVWARLLDVPAALSARRYGTESTLTIEVADAFRPESGGTFELAGGPDGATCERVGSATPDLTLGAPELGAVYLGGVAPSLLAAAGRIAEHVPGALARADALFVTQPAPWCPLMF